MLGERNVDRRATLCPVTVHALSAGTSTRSCDLGLISRDIKETRNGCDAASRLGFKHVST